MGMASLMVSILYNFMTHHGCNPCQPTSRTYLQEVLETAQMVFSGGLSIDRLDVLEGTPRT